MPNDVTNIVKFEGDNTNILNLFKLMGGEEKNTIIDFNKIIPCPNYIYTGSICSEEEKIYGDNNWYNWNISNWGTKWNAYNQSIMPINCSNVKFDTASYAPIPVLTKLSSFYSDVVITHFYSDEGENFMGKAAYYNGAVLYSIEIPNEFSNTTDFQEIKARCDIANEIYTSPIRLI